MLEFVESDHHESKSFPKQGLYKDGYRPKRIKYNDEIHYQFLELTRWTFLWDWSKCSIIKI